MQHTTLKSAFLTLILAFVVALAACDNNDTPTSPTQAGPTVVTPTPTPTPDPAPPPTPPPPVAEQPTVTLTGRVDNLDRSGAGDLDISFRIDDFTIVRAAAGTPVMSGGQTFRTDAIRNGQTVVAEGTRTNGFLDASRLTITAQAP